LIISSILRKWLKDHPEVFMTFEVHDDNSVTATAWNPDKTRILKQFALSPEQQTSCIVRFMPVLEGFL
jgi:hypothetical protein